VIYPDYNPQTTTEALSDDELQALDELLAALPSDGALNIEALDGFLTGLLVGPVLAQRLRGTEWLPLVWGGDGPGEHAPFESNRQRKKVVVQALRHLRAIDMTLQNSPDAWAPVFSVAEEDEREWVDATDWCVGFLQAVDLDKEAWSPWFDSALTGPALVPLVLLGSEESELSAADAQRLADPQTRDQLSRTLLDAVLALRPTEAPAQPDHPAA
jgi:uncharacterized protein